MSTSHELIASFTEQWEWNNQRRRSSIMLVSREEIIRPDIGRIEKWVLHTAFYDEKNPYLPKVLLHSLPELSLIFALVCTYNEQSAARATVPGGPSVPCSTAKAVEWDAAWSQNLDLSGRAALGVHVAAYEEDKAEGTRPKKLQKLAEKTAEAIV
ncbi:hypothetical protein YC2023_044895 [Brassica napus]